MNGYDASRAGPVDYGYAGHGHGAGQHDQQQQQYQSTNTQWGELQQGHGNGYINYGKHQQIGYTSYQQPRYGAGPSASSSSSLPFSQPQADHAGTYAQRQQYAQQQQQQAHHYNQQYDSRYDQNAGGPSIQPKHQSSARPSAGNQRTASSSSSSNVKHYPASSVSQYQSGSAGVEASPRYPETRDQRRLPSKSPTLPALNTSTSVNTSGFGSLFQQQLEAEIDEIQAKHTPISSPTSGSFPNLNLTPQPGRPTVSSNNSDMRHVPMRNDSGNTVTGDSHIDPSGYGGSGIISMYDPRIPSPIPSDDAQSAQQAGFSQHHSSAASRYQPPPSQYQLSSRSTSMQNSMPQTSPYQSAPPSTSNRQPTTPAYERQRRPSGPDRTYRSASGATSEHSSHSAAVPLSSSMGSVRPLPSSPSTSSHAHSSQSSVRTGRPSQESNFSSYTSSSRAAFPSGPSSGTVAPRPSMSSSLASRPSLNFSESSHSRQHVRPLPVPNPSNEGPEQLRTGYVDSPDAYETLPPIRERARSERSRQSDFTKDFYAAGPTVPENYVKQHSTSTPRPPPPSNTGRHPAADRYRLQSHHSQQPNEHHQYAQAHRAHTAAPIISPSMSSLSGASISSTATLSSSPAPLGQGHGFAHPPIVHSYSDPSADSRSSSSSSRARKNSGQALAMSSSRTPKSSASRSASFSNAGAAAARERSDDSSRRNVSMGNRSNSKMSSQYQIPESSPPLPSSPSISVSTTFNDASFSSTYSTLSTAPSQSTYTSAMRKQPSLSPSNMSLSAGGFLSSKNGRDTDRERRRMEGLGLQHLNPALLSNLAVAFKDRIPRTLNVKGSVHYPSSFTGEQVVSCLAEILPFPYTDNRGIAVAIARNLHRNMFFNEVDWDDARQLRDSQEQVFCFQDDEEQATFDYLTGNTAGGSVYSPAARAPDSASKTQEIPNGVITRFTKCYSPFCGMEGTAGSGACYSLYCPNGAHPLGLQRKQSALSLAPSSTTEEQAPPEAWASTVATDLIEQLGPKEVARQNVIFEIVTGEQAYKKDLDMLEMAYAEPLRSANPPVIEPNRLTSFANQVFANLDELRAHSGRLVNAFQVRQREQNPVVESIGDLVLDAALEWGQAYMDFAEAQVMGEYLVNEEKTTNSAFATFLQSRREAFGIKQDFRHYHLRATIRLQRYLLPLAEYIKRCPDDHPDRETTQEAMRIIRQQCDACNAAVAAAQLRLACIRYDKLLERDFNYVNDLDLLHPSRQLFHHGRMYAKPEGARSEWTEYQVMVFDHYLVIAKPRRIVEGYRLIRKPIRLEMFSTTGWEDPPTIRSSGFHLSNVIRTGERREASTSNHAGDKPESKMWPIAFRISGRTSGILTLFVETPKNDKDGHARKEWKSKLEQAIAVQKAVMDANQVFQLKMLMDPDLRRTPATSVHGAASMGKVLASCPFTGPTGQRLVAVGTSTGLYIALKHDPTTLRQILQISTQYCAVLQDFGMFLVHTEGRLLSYLLETLVQTSSSESKGQQGPQQVSGQKDILFFKVGRVGPRTLVVYAKKDGVNSTVLKAMEPVANVERSRVQHSRFLGMGGKKTEWFRLFKDAAVPTEVYNLSFTRSKLALVCAPGFEILDIDTLKTGSFPDWTAIKTDPTKFDAATAMLQRRCLESRAIGLFRISDSEFLFCYEDFAFFADRHGDPVRARFGDMIEWEGRPDTVVYCRPYVLAFDSRFIEVRDTSRRGKLVQIIRGNNIRCTYDGQGLPSSEMEVRMGGSVEAEERLPHFVMRENNVDRLYELAPRA